MKRTWEIIGAPYDLSANETGASEAPSFVRKAFVSKWEKCYRDRWGISMLDGGDVIPSVRATDADRLADLAEYTSSLCARVLESFKAGNTPVVIGGDHSISIGSVGAASSYLKRLRPEGRLGLLWIDAHADINTGQGGNPHGKAAAILLGFGPSCVTELGGFAPKVQSQHLIEIGLRDLMPSELAVMREHKVEVHPMHDVDRRGIREVCSDAIARLEKETDAFFLSIDIDASEGECFGACAAPMVGGLTARELRTVVEMAEQSDKFCGMDIVEFCPTKDEKGHTGAQVVAILNTLVGYTKFFWGQDTAE